MPFDYSVLKEHRLVLVIGSGRVTTTEVKACIDRAMQDPDFNPNFDEFVDLRDVTAVDIRDYEVRTLASSRLYSSNSRHAFLAPKPSVFGMARMWQAYSESSGDTSPMLVCYDLGEALNWLGRASLPLVG